MLNDTFIVFDSIIVWMIIILAVFCYSLLIDLSIFSKPSKEWYQNTQYWSDSLRHLLGALPLLGLLGTITGLLETFFLMSIDSVIDKQELISGGIASAMFTTQVGLLLVVPGWLMLGFLDKKVKSYFIEHSREIVCAEH